MRSEGFDTNCNVITGLITRKLEKRIKGRVVIERKKREEDNIWVF
jgi:chorismate synthase